MTRKRVIGGIVLVLGVGIGTLLTIYYFVGETIARTMPNNGNENYTR